MPIEIAQIHIVVIMMTPIQFIHSHLIYRYIWAYKRVSIRLYLESGTPRLPNESKNSFLDVQKQLVLMDLKGMI